MQAGSSQLSISSARVEQLEPRTFLSGDVSAQSSPPVQVGTVFLSGSKWTPTYKQHLESLSHGRADYGFAVSDFFNQTSPQTWVNVDRISLSFSTAVVAGPEDLRVRGVRGEYPVAGYEFDRALAVATWTLASPLPADRLELRLNVDGPGGVIATYGQLVDGDRDGLPGGDFTYRFNMLPGDARDSAAIDDFDVQYVRQLQGGGVGEFAAPGRGYYYYPADVNGDGRINVVDRAEVRRRLGTSLPPEQPPPPAVAGAAGAASPLRSRPVARSQFSTSPILGR